MPAHFYNDIRRTYMRLIRVLGVIILVLSMGCHAQKVTTSELNGTKWREIKMSDLVGKTWKAVSGYDGSDNIDWSITFSMESSEHRFIGKSDNKVSRFIYNTYLCPLKPEKYDATLLGKSTKGKYLVFERQYTYEGKVYEDFFCSEILFLTSSRLTIRMKNSTVLFCACDTQIVTPQQLKNTSWHLKEPSNPNVDTYFEFSDRVLTNVSDAHYADTKFRKGLKKKYINKYSYYIANQVPSCFDSKKVGQLLKGSYIVQELDGDFFWFQIIQFSSSELKVKTKLGQTFVFEKV